MKSIFRSALILAALGVLSCRKEAQVKVSSEAFHQVYIALVRLEPAIKDPLTGRRIWIMMTS